MDDSKLSVHAMPMDALRARAREADRIIEQARAIVRRSFARDSKASPDSSAGQQVGNMLDAIERLLPGVGVLAVQLTDRAPVSRVATHKAAERAERDTIVHALAERIAALLVDIERARSTQIPRTTSSVASSRSPYRRG